MKEVIIDGTKTYAATNNSSINEIILVHKDISEMTEAYAAFRSAAAISFNGTEFQDKLFDGLKTIESGENIEAHYLFVRKPSDKEIELQEEIDSLKENIAEINRDIASKETQIETLRENQADEEMIDKAAAHDILMGGN